MLDVDSARFIRLAASANHVAGLPNRATIAMNARIGTIDKCPKGDSRARSTIAIVRAPKPKCASVQWWSPKYMPTVGSVRIVPTTVRNANTGATE